MPASTVPAPSAVGASVALDKVCAAIANMEEPVRETVRNTRAHTHTHWDLTFLITVIKEQEAVSYLMMAFYGSPLPHSHF